MKKPSREPVVGDAVQFVRGELVRAGVVVRVHDAQTVNLQTMVDGDVPPVWETNVRFEAEARRLNAQKRGFPVGEFWRWRSS